MPRQMRSLALLLAALVPAVIVGRLTWASSPSPKQPITRDDILRDIPSKPGILININRRLFPATGKITLLGRRATLALRKGLLGNTDTWVRWRVVQILAQLRDASARPELHQALTDWNAGVRHQALRALAFVGDKSSLQPVLARLQDPREPPRNWVAALRALGRIGQAGAAPAITAAYKRAKDQPNLRYAAVTAMWDLRRQAPRPALRSLLHLALDDKDESVARRAAISLGLLEDSTALSKLQKLLSGPSLRLRNVAAYVIGQIGDKAGIPILAAALPHVRSGRLLNNICFALKRLADPKLWDRLRGLLAHQQAFVRLNAAFTVGEMQLRVAVPHVMALLKDPNHHVRTQAVATLGKIGDPRAVPALVKQITGGRSLHERLAMRAALLLSPLRQHRDRIVSELSRYPRHRREAALLLAAKRDLRAAPLIYGLVSHRADQQAWRAAERLRSPTLRGLVLASVATAAARSNLSGLPEMLRYLSVAELRRVKRPLLDLLAKRFWQLQQVHVAYERALRATLRALGSLSDPTLRTWLAYFVGHKNHRVRLEAHLALARTGSAASLNTLIQELATAADSRRGFVARLLGRLPVARLRGAMRPWLRQRDPYLRLALGAALFYAGDPRPPTLVAALRSSQTMVRWRARTYLRADLDAARHARLVQMWRAERDPVARAELARVWQGHDLGEPLFAVFRPREIRYY